MKYVSKKIIFENLVLLYVFITPFSVAPLLISTNVFIYVNMLLSVLGFFILLSNNIKLYVGSILLKSFFIPLIISILIGVPTALLFSPLGINYWDLPELMIGRIINYIFIYLIFKSTLLTFQTKTIHEKTRFTYKYVRAYLIGCLLLLAIGFWQLLSWETGIPFPFEGMRSHVHSVDTSSITVKGRMTSLAAEPSYFVPFIIDFIILSILLLKRIGRIIAILFGLVGVYFTFSGGGYLDIFITVSVFIIIYIYQRVLFYSIKSSPYKLLSYIFIAFCFIVFLIISIPNISLPENINIVLDRREAIFDINQHSRAAFVFKPLELMLDTNFINFIFGHGPKSYALIGSKYYYFGGAFHVTSNNLFTDLFWEHGLIGLIGLAILFIYFFKNSVTVKRKATIEEWVILLLSTHLISSSFYRADYASGRFFIICTILIILIENNKQRLKFQIN